MSRLGSATAMVGAAVSALLMLSGCNGQRPEAAAPPPIASTPPPAATPDLMGGPPETAAAPVSSEAPVSESEQAFSQMAPVANPEDMSPEERVQVYGHGYDRLSRAAETPSPPRHHAPRHFMTGWARAGVHHVGHRRWTRQERWRRYALGHQERHVHAGQTTAAAAASHESARRPAGDLAARTSAPPAPTPSATPEAATSSQAAAAVIAPPSPAAPLGSSNLDWLSIPGAPYLDLPGLGRIASKFITAIVLLLLAIALLAIAAGRGRAAGRRRRPARTSVGAGPSFSSGRSSEPASIQRDTAVAPFPHHDAAAQPEPARN